MIGFSFILMGVVGFLFQLIFTGRIHRVLGVGVGMRVLPGTLAVAQIGVVLAVGAGGGLSPCVGVVPGRGQPPALGGPGHRELLFLPVAEELRVRAKAFIDVFVQRFGKGAAAILILVTIKFLPPASVSVLTLVLAVVWLFLTFRARREYVTAFREGLKSGTLQPDAAIDPTDVTTVTTLVQSLGSSDPRQGAPQPRSPCRQR